MPPESGDLYHATHSGRDRLVLSGPVGELDLMAAVLLSGVVKACGRGSGQVRPVSLDALPGRHVAQTRAGGLDDEAARGEMLGFEVAGETSSERRCLSVAVREWRGRWWLPNEPEDAVAGILTANEEGDLALKLIGGFPNYVSIPVRETASATAYEPEFIEEFPIILGDSAGAPFTLLQCTPRHTGHGAQDIGVLRALRGIHLNGADDEVFSSAILKIEYLLGWMRSSTMKRTVELDNGHWTGKQTAMTEPVQDLEATHAGYDYTLSVEFDQFRAEDRFRANERMIVNRERAELKAASPQSANFRDFERKVKAVMDLMTLAAHEPAGVIEETLWLAPREADAGPAEQVSQLVEVIGRQVHRPKPGPRETVYPEYLFTLDDVAFADILPRWLDLHERTWNACTTMFGLRYIPRWYVTARLLMVATAAEAMHRELRPKATRLTFMNRLRALAGMPDREAVRILIHDIEKWAKYIKDERNGMARADREPIGTAEAGRAFDALEVTFALLGLVLLKELGLCPELQRRAASAQYLHLMVDRFNKDPA